MYTTFLYVKQHKKTKLKYFGKTIRNPYTYKGSGLYWRRHIKQHGAADVETIEVWEFTDPNECEKFALQYSKNNNIVESTEWANLVDENGLDGQTPGLFKGLTYEEIYGVERGAMLRESRKISNSKRICSQETKNKMSESAKKRIDNGGYRQAGWHHSEEVKNKLSKHSKEKWTPELRKSLALKKSGGYYITPWGTFYSSVTACQDKNAMVADPTTLRSYCNQNTRARKRLGNKKPIELGFSFLPI